MTLIEIAKESGFTVDEFAWHDHMFERFAELVRADERKKWEGQTAVEINEAVLDEREACAKVLEDRAKHIETNHRRPHYGFPYELRQSIAAIRARGQQ